MGKGKKCFNKKRKGPYKAVSKKKKFINKEREGKNKKAIFNRYKDKQKIEEEFNKKKQMEQRFQKQQPAYSESEEEAEEDSYGQLVSCFKSNGDTNMISESDGEISGEEPDGCGNMNGTAKSVDMEQNENNHHCPDEGESSDEQDVLIEEPEINNEVNTSNDPFTRHLQYDLQDELVVALSNTPTTVKETSKTWPVLGNLVITIPQPLVTSSKSTKPKFSLLEEKVYAPLATVPHVTNKVDFQQLYLKSQICGNIVSANTKNLIKRDLELTDIFTPLQKELFAIMNNYQDLYYPERTFSNADEIRFTYCLHIANHMIKTRAKILHHNAKIAKKSDLTEDYQDQGLVRPKVLIMVPFKDAAYRVVKTLIDIVVPKEAGQVVNKNRFEEDFTGGELIMPTKNPKPEDYELLFSGNTDDTFRLGLTLTKKTLKLYTDFYSSDILIASPLGLRMVVGAEGEEARDYDFLAAVELLVLDQADVFLMQNWDHALHVLDHLHLQPKTTHGTDFSRVRSWAVNGWAKYYRQTLVFSSVSLPEIKSVLNRKCGNYAGKVLVANAPAAGSIQQVLVQVPQLFHRFNAASPLAAVDARFEYFVKEVLPRHRDALMSHTLVYVPSYFDFVRIRNYFKKEDISFVQICEYSKDAKIARARDMFFHTEAHFLLYSERGHFFRRLRIKGIRHIIFYQPPTYPHFYSEMCNLMQESNQNKYGGSECNMSLSVLHCAYDAARVAALLGAARAAQLAAADKPVHIQTLVFSSVSLPEIKSVLNRKCGNYAGKVLVANAPAAGSIQQVLVQVPQLFHRFNAASPLAAVDARFEYFVKEVLPRHRDALMSHTLVYVPSYFDFVRIRNYFKKEDISFVQICEYSKDAKIARARDMFFHTEAHFLLYSERGHFFRRLRIKGIRHIIFYQPPTYPHFYSEMCNLMQESNQNKYGGSECNMSLSVLHCAYDAARVAALLGAARAAQLAAADKPVHMYVTGDK